MGTHRREKDARTYEPYRARVFFCNEPTQGTPRVLSRETRDSEEDARRDGTTMVARGGGDDDDGCRLDRVARMRRRKEKRESDTAGGGDDARVFDHGKRAGGARGGCPREGDDGRARTGDASRSDSRSRGD